MRGLRLSVLEYLTNQGRGHEYAIADHFHIYANTVRKILDSFEKNKIARFVGHGPRGAKIYEPTEAGEKAYEVAKDVAEKVELVPKEELVIRHTKEAVELAIVGSLIEPMDREESLVKIGPDAPPPSSEDRLTIRRIASDIIGRGNRRIYALRLKCSHCGYVGPVPKWVIFPQVRAIASNFFGVCGCLCPDCNRLALITSN